ncbi:MAG: indole-3-glycerol phosphate synthase TrpC [Alphaproteobacteria bacterium]|nr:indole-3-glycerol phosphate synthase TrpC [Alphaproteobacteria bacterium]
MTDTLSRIIAYKREEVAARRSQRTFADVDADARRQPAARGFAEALKTAHAEGRYALIAEIKKASPSRGLIRTDFHPSDLARAFSDGGAACLSVLTDCPSFQGDDTYLVEARAACALPALRKDFMIDPWQVAESRALGADAILVIMAAVDDGLAAELVAAADDYDMDALVECHDAEEVRRALRLPARMIGVNNRDLRTFVTRLETTEELAPLVPPDRILVAESGIAAPADIKQLARAGATAFLVGESLMREDDVAPATRRLLGLAV